MGRKLVAEFIEACQIRVQLVTKEQAAQEFLARDVKFRWYPQIVEEARGRVESIEATKGATGP